MKVEIRLAGSGGQGLLLAGVILAEAAGVYDRRRVVQTQSYGPEARGGASRSDLLISDEEIFYPEARRLDILGCLSQRSCDAYISDLKPGGLLLLDSFYVRRAPEGGISLPFTERSRKEFGRETFANMILLGAIAALTGVVSREALLKAVEQRVPKGTIETNLKAVELGYKLAQEVKR